MSSYRQHLAASCIRRFRSSRSVAFACALCLSVIMLSMSGSPLHAAETTAWPAPLILPAPAYAQKPFTLIEDSAQQPAVASSTYFRTTSTLYNTPSKTFAGANLPPDEVAKFHQLDTHVPLKFARITSHFGHRHNPLGKGDVFHSGIDLAAPVGTPVQAVAAGTVIKAGMDRRGYGNFVVIDHHNGYRTLYAHNSKLLVKVGEHVKVGQVIAKVGSSGRSTGPHLHFEIHRDGKRVDPSPYLAGM